jgi:integrase/recombinase XerD
MTTALTVRTSATIIDAAPYDTLVETTLNTLPSLASQRVYRDTYNKWADYCHNHGLDPMLVLPNDVTRFLNAQPVGKASKQRQLSALRKLAVMWYVTTGSEDARRAAEGMKLVKASSADTGKTRTRKALQPHEADKVLRTWNGDTLLDKRNRALVAVLLLGGLRRSEAAALKWANVDFEAGILTVEHGKGDKYREVPLVGDYAITALLDWKQAQGGDRVYVFCPFRRWDVVGEDKPINGVDVYRTIETTVATCGIDFKPHDARRTIITELIEAGTPMNTVQAFAGHAHGSTTLSYARTANMRAARKTMRARFG